MHWLVKNQLIEVNHFDTAANFNLRRRSLRRLRKTAHGGPRADTAPACLGTEVGTIVAGEATMCPQGKGP